MASLSTWNPYLNHVQQGLQEGRFASGRFTLIASGPPFLSNISAGTGLIAGETGRDVVYPIGLIQNFGWGQNRAWARFFEIGSDRSVVISGHTVGQIGLGRVVYDGPSLLRVMWAFYKDALAGINNLYDNQAINVVHQHTTVFPPGYENLLLNLASDMFSQPIGLLVVFKNNDLDNLGAYYFERCVVPTHNIGWDATSGIIQESLSIQFERALPIRMGNVVKLLRGTD